MIVQIPREKWLQVRALDAKCFPWDLRIENDPKVTWWMTYVDKRPAAYCGAYSWDLENTCVLHRAAVLPEFRGRGLQRLMIQQRIDWAQAKGHAEVWTYTSPANIRSANNLIALGFTLWRPAHWAGIRDTHLGLWLYWRRAI